MNKIVSFGLLIFLIPLIFVISISIFISSGLPIIHWSKRVGQENKLFLMPKFRTMHANTPQKATHLMKGEKKHITFIGQLLRKGSLDEIPQLYSVISGKMNFIGPRPALFNQIDLVTLRTKSNIHLQKPGITGWAQVNGRDNLSIKEKVDAEKYYLENHNLALDLKIFFLTILKIFKISNISH